MNEMYKNSAGSLLPPLSSPDMAEDQGERLNFYLPISLVLCTHVASSTRATSENCLLPQLLLFASRYCSLWCGVGSCMMLSKRREQLLEHLLQSDRASFPKMVIHFQRFPSPTRISRQDLPNCQTCAGFLTSEQPPKCDSAEEHPAPCSTLVNSVSTRGPVLWRPIEYGAFGDFPNVSFRF